MLRFIPLCMCIILDLHVGRSNLLAGPTNSWFRVVLANITRDKFTVSHSKVKTLGKLDGTFDIRNQTDTKIDHTATENITLRNLIFAIGSFADVDYQIDFAFLDEMKGGPFFVVIIIFGLRYDSHLDAIGLFIVLASTRGRIKVVPQLRQDLRSFEKFETELVARDGQKNTFCLVRELETGRQHSLKEGFVRVLAEAGDLPGGGHFDAQSRIGSAKTRERKDGGLN